MRFEFEHDPNGRIVLRCGRTVIDFSMPGVSLGRRLAERLAGSWEKGRNPHRARRAAGLVTGSCVIDAAGVELLRRLEAAERADEYTAKLIDELAHLGLPVDMLIDRKRAAARRKAADDLRCAIGVAIEPSVRSFAAANERTVDQVIDLIYLESNGFEMTVESWASILDAIEPALRGLGARRVCDTQMSIAIVDLAAAHATAGCIGA